MSGLESVFSEEMCVPTEPQEKKCYNSIDLRKLAEENARLRSKVDNLSNALDEQKIGFERKCGAVEYELEEYRKVNKVLEAENEKRFAELVHQNQCLTEKVEELRAAVEHYKVTLQEETNRNAQIDAYLMGLPTKEEHTDALSRFKLAQQHATDLEGKLAATNSKLEQYESKLSSATMQLKRFEDREKMLQTQLDMAMQRLRSQSGSSSSPGVSSQVTPEFVDDLHRELNRYRSSFEQVKKLLEAESHRAEAADAHLQMTKCQFEEQLAREAAGITGLKTTLAARRTEIRQLKTRISELNTEKQELLSQLLATKSALSQSNSLWKSTEGTQRSRLLTALLQTVGEMKRLSNQLSKMAEGQRPDLASLLFEPKPLSDWSNSVADFNVSTSPRDDADLITAPGSPLNIPRNMCFGHQQSPFPECDLRTQAEQVQNIYEQLAELRKHLADRYAEHLGGKLDCFVQ